MKEGFTVDVGQMPTITKTLIQGFEFMYIRVKTPQDFIDLERYFPYFEGRLKRGVIFYSGAPLESIKNFVKNTKWECPPAVMISGLDLQGLNERVDAINVEMAKRYPLMEKYLKTLVLTTKGLWDNKPASTLKNNIAAKSMLYIVDGSTATMPAVPIEYDGSQWLIREVNANFSYFQTDAYFEKYGRLLPAMTSLQIPIQTGNDDTGGDDPGGGDNGGDTPTQTVPGTININIKIPEKFTIEIIHREGPIAPVV